jgi:glycosyltransferase involved in cell wall biosynthesis
MLTNELLKRGHSAIWWASTFSHQRKQLLFDADWNHDGRNHLILKLLYCGGYKSNFSLGRYLHHRKLAERFKDVSERTPEPDIIVCSFPIIDLADQAVRYARRHGIPIIVDVRDLWPDIHLKRFPAILRRPGRLLFFTDDRKNRYIFAHADSLTAISHGCLDWALAYLRRSGGRHDKVFYTGYPDDPAILERRSFQTPDYLMMHKGKVIFSFVGTFGGSYDLRTICDVAETSIARGIKDVHFVLAGEGDQYEYIASRARTLPNVSLPGWLNSLQIKMLLAHSDVGLSPIDTVRHAMPNKIYEYLSAGLPIISSLEGEMEHVLEQYGVGYSYRCRDGGILFRHIVTLANDSALRQKMSAKARALFESRFRAEDIYRDFADHVERIAKERIDDRRECNQVRSLSRLEVGFYD